MLRTSCGILAEIIQHKQQEVAELRVRAGVLEQQAYERKSQVRGFAAALAAISQDPSLGMCPEGAHETAATSRRATRRPAIIGEIKKASPSKGVLQPDFHPALLARAYEQGGAACLSVLTDKQYFQGGLSDLEAARAAVSLPVLRKDFIIDRLQIFEAAAHGADAILLIAAVLDTPELQSFRELASSLGLDSLVEVHDHDELTKAIDSGASIIGVNNRNLDTFEVSLDTSLRLSYQMPANVVRVSESGIRNRGDIEVLLGAGYTAFLVGEWLMRSDDPAVALRELVGKT